MSGVLGRRISRLVEVVSREKFWIVLGKVLRKLTLETFAVHAFFQSDLEQIPASRAFPEDVEVRQYQGADQLETVVALLRGTRLTPAMIACRLQRGDRVAIALCRGETAGYVWMNTCGAHYVDEIGRTLIFGPREIVQHDAFVLPPWRGRGLQHLMSWSMRKDAQQRGYRYALAYVDLLNSRSFSSQKSQGKRAVLWLLTVRVPLVRQYINFPLTCSRTLHFRNPIPGSELSETVAQPKLRKQPLRRAAQKT